MNGRSSSIGIEQNDCMYFEAMAQIRVCSVATDMSAALGHHRIRTDFTSFELWFSASGWAIV